MKKIALITGATGGLGKEFVKLLLKEDIDEIWAVARNVKKLETLKNEFGEKIKPISKDLSNSEEVKSLPELVKKEDAELKYLINNAGIARMDLTENFTADEIEKTLDLNCKALALLSVLSIPLMKKGSHILNISSMSSFQPVPYINLYASTKVFERSFSRALNAELKKKGITVTAVCPGWTDTELLSKEMNGNKVKFPGLVKPSLVAEKAINDAKRGKDMSVCTAYAKYIHFISKISPQKAVMRTWLKGIRKYVE